MRKLRRPRPAQRRREAGDQAGPLRRRAAGATGSAAGAARSTVGLPRRTGRCSAFSAGSIQSTIGCHSATCGAAWLGGRSNTVKPCSTVRTYACASRSTPGKGRPSFAAQAASASAPRVRASTRMPTATTLQRPSATRGSAFSSAWHSAADSRSKTEWQTGMTMTSAKAATRARSKPRRPPGVSRTTWRTPAGGRSTRRGSTAQPTIGAESRQRPGGPLAQPALRRLLAVDVAEHDGVAAAGVEGREVGGERALAAASLAIDDGDDGHGGNAEGAAIGAPPGPRRRPIRAAKAGQLRRSHAPRRDQVPTFRSARGVQDGFAAGRLRRAEEEARDGDVTAREVVAHDDAAAHGQLLHRLGIDRDPGQQQRLHLGDRDVLDHADHVLRLDDVGPAVHLLQQRRVLGLADGHVAAGPPAGAAGRARPGRRSTRTGHGSTRPGRGALAASAGALAAPSRRLRGAPAAAADCRRFSLRTSCCSRSFFQASASASRRLSPTTVSLQRGAVGERLGELVEALACRRRRGWRVPGANSMRELSPPPAAVEGRGEERERRRHGLDDEVRDHLPDHAAERELRVVDASR